MYTRRRKTLDEAERGRYIGRREKEKEEEEEEMEEEKRCDNEVSYNHFFVTWK